MVLLWFEILKKKKAGKATATHNSKGEPKDYCAKEADKSYVLKGSAYKSGYDSMPKKRLKNEIKEMILCCGKKF